MGRLQSFDSVLLFNALILLVCYGFKPTAGDQQQEAPPAPTADLDDGQQLARLKAGGQLAQVQRELERMRWQLARLRAAPQGDGLEEEEEQQQQQLAPIRRERKLTWQPLKRKRLTWQPLKRNSAYADVGQQQFTVKFRHTPELRQQLLDTIESHLLEDLAAAQEYGIEPQQILMDLQQKQRR